MSLSSILSSLCRKKSPSQLDVHTHTIASGHSYSTMTEMIEAAQKKGLKILGITEHGPSIPGTCDPIHFKNLWVVPRQYGRLRLMLGAELNILDTKGTIDSDEKHWRMMDLRIAGIHSLCWTGGTKEENTAGVIAAMHNPWIQIISHPVDGTAELDIEQLVLASKLTGTILELNNNSLRPGRKKPQAVENNRELLLLCKKYEVPVLIGSDAHIWSDVANHADAYALAHELGFPDRLILNRSAEAFLAALKPDPE